MKKRTWIILGTTFLIIVVLAIRGPAVRFFALRAVEKGDLSLLESVLALGKSVVHERDEWNDTLLSRAVEKDNPEIVSRLLAAGADPNQYGTRVGPPLHHAAFFGQTEIVVGLLEAGADVTLQVPVKTVGTALHAAALGGHIDCIKQLIAKGSKINEVRHGTTGNTPLHAAITQYPISDERYEVIELLVKLGADLNVLDTLDRTPAERAEYFDHESNDRDGVFAKIADFLRKQERRALNR
jgi:ankyrin repeat protein